MPVVISSAIPDDMIAMESIFQWEELPINLDGFIGVDTGDQTGNEIVTEKIEIDKDGRPQLVTYVVDDRPRGEISTNGAKEISVELTTIDWKPRALVAEKRVKELEKENNRLRLQVMRRGRK